MQLCNIDISTDSSKVIDVTMRGLKDIRKDIVSLLTDEMSDYRWTNSPRITSRQAKEWQDMIGLIAKLTENIEACENGSKLLENG